MLVRLFLEPINLIISTCLKFYKVLKGNKKVII